MVPGFDPEGGLGLVLLRGGADAGLLSAFGSLLALAWLAPPLLPSLGAAAPRALAALRRVAALSVLAAGVGAVAWLQGESVDMAGAVSAAPAVLADTLYGHLIAARMALLILAGVLLALRWHGTAAVAASVALASQAGHDHAWAMGGPSWLLLSNIVHLLAAGAWLGGLVPLLLLVAAASPEVAVRASQRFSALGTACVLLIGGTALFQAAILVGSWSALAGSAYGWVIGSKLVLFLILVAIAVRNRFQLTPALDRGGGKGALLWSLGIETAASLLVVLAAALLTSLQPGMEM